MPGRRYLFIGGLHRSGTSILHQCLCDHPEVSGFQATGVPEDEGQHLQSVFPTALAWGGPGRFGFNAGSFMGEDSAFVSTANRDQLLAEWGVHWDQSKQVLVEKSPPNLVRTRFLQALFPDARFLMIMRHPVAVSCATQKWSKTPLEQLLAHWIVCHRRLWRDRPFLTRCLVLRYEDFVQAPQQVLSDVYRFVGVSDYPLQRAVRADINGRYFARWSEALSSGALRDRLHAYRLASKYELAVRRFGYSLLHYS